ncbi:Mariner Mos1 transposase [Eumeta japonica]|uniref:Mariner Mos1 transposase n=1 Tax=Eumeta variegata TaxID=151549 RepID=A0A4C1W5S7_EUMVA|nr:Mariner Mos1 transposase [Eumeta japonica]
MRHKPRKQFVTFIELTLCRRPVTDKVNGILEKVQQDPHISFYTKVEELKINHKIKNLITGDEKWTTYVKNVRKRSWSKGKQASQIIAKPGLSRIKLMLCVWWDWKGSIHYELLSLGKTINSDPYCQQLIRLKQEVDKKWRELINRKGVVVHHGNATPHTSFAIQQILREFG